jgi:hypothetical protein
VSTGILFKATAKPVRIDFQRNRLVASALKKSANVKLAEARNAKLPILFHVDEFVMRATRSELDMSSSMQINRGLAGIRQRVDFMDQHLHLGGRMYSAHT